jgi:hypothetical protein
VEEAIGETHEVNDLGSSGKMIILFKLLFQKIQDIFTAVLDQLVFNKAALDFQ